MNSVLKYNWKVILIFFFVATIISLIFRLYEPTWLSFLKLPYGYGLNLLVGAGPFLAAVLCRRVFANEIAIPKLSLFGNSVLRSMLFMLAPVLVFIVLGINNKEGLDIHLFGLKTGLFWLIYIFGEEYGWRGYLQQMLPGQSIIKAIVIGVIWYFWHLSFVFDSYDLSKELVFMLVLIVGSYIAILVINRTNSLLTAVGLHFSFSVMTNVPFTENYKYGVIAMLIFWGLILLSWKHE